MKQKEADSVYTKNIALQPVLLNASFVFNNVLFANNSFELPKTGLIELEKLLQVLQENPSLKLQIGGHTDNTGKPEDNEKLSTNRAKSIVEWLTSKGIESNRLSFKGYAATKPIADNTTEAGRAKNRRTEFTITGL